MCIFATALHWAVWLWHFCFCIVAMRRVYGKMLGFDGIAPILAGLMGFADLKPAVPVAAESESGPFAL